MIEKNLKYFFKISFSLEKNLNQKKNPKKCCNKINKATTRLKHEINKTKPNYNFKIHKTFTNQESKTKPWHLP
jgi:hypothetical protein